MDYFDDEPSAGGGYNDDYPVPLDGADGIPRRIVVREAEVFGQEGGEFE